MRDLSPFAIAPTHPVATLPFNQLFLYREKKKAFFSLSSPKTSIIISRFYRRRHVFKYRRPRVVKCDSIPRNAKWDPVYAHLNKFIGWEAGSVVHLSFRSNVTIQVGQFSFHAVWRRIGKRRRRRQKPKVLW